MSVGYISFMLFFFSLPASTVFLVFLKDSDRRRRVLLSAVLVANTLLYFSPLAYAYLKTPAGGNMWSENGPGAALWLYMYLFPVTIGLQYVLGARKIRATKEDSDRPH